MDLRLHFLEAGHGLGGLRPVIEGRVAATGAAIEAAVAGRASLPAVDLLVAATRRGVIPGLGVGGFCFEPHRIEIHVDPSGHEAADSVASGVFDGILAHEFHHAMRWAGPAMAGRSGRLSSARGWPTGSTGWSRAARRRRGRRGSTRPR